MRSSAGPLRSSAALTDRSSICFARRCATPDGWQDRIAYTERRPEMQGRSAQNNPAPPAALMRSTPRPVRLNSSGGMVTVAAIALIVAAVWGGTELYRRAKLSERQVTVLESEAITADAEVVRVQRRGSGNDRRSTVHYRYVARSEPHIGYDDRTQAGPRSLLEGLASGCSIPRV